MSTIHQAQQMVFDQLQQELASFKNENDRLVRELGKQLQGKEMVRTAQSVKWSAKRIARLAYAIEVLESCDPHYPL